MSSKPPKPTYWEQRAEQKEKLIQGHTTKAVQSIANAYDKANSEITAEVKRIFETYKKEHGLTDEEAGQLISHTETKELIQYLKFKLNTIADERIRKDILNRINAVSYAARITRLEAMSERVGAVFKQTADIELATDKSVLGNAYKESYYRTIFDYQQGFGIGADFALIPEKALKTVIESKFMGKNFSERVWTNTNALAEKLKTVLSAGIASGASIEKMSNDIADLSKQGKMMATRLIRTETTFYMGQGELKAYAELGIDKYKYLATLDSRTSPMCAELDGEVFNVADAVPGENYPPLHAWCRSTTIAYFGDEDTGTRIARDKDGKTYKVPSDMTYDEWKEKYVADAISTSDKEQFEKYKPILQELSPKTLEEFINIKYNDSDKWKDLKAKYRILNRYEIDGNVSATKVLELDRAAWDTKQNGFDCTGYSGKQRRNIKALKNSGNAAAMEFNGDIYFAHSRAEKSGTYEYDSYKGKYPIVGVMENRRYTVKDLGDNIPRENDTEAKFLEFVATKINTDRSDVITILSEKHICESCQGVVEQFKKDFPNVKVNIVSGKKEYNGSEQGTNTWKYRK